jgi:hypothetical protein
MYGVKESDKPQQHVTLKGKNHFLFSVLAYLLLFCLPITFSHHTHSASTVKLLSVLYIANGSCYR